MYCPKCSAHNLDAAQFCRSCGANLALVPQALTGQLPTAPVQASATAVEAKTDDNIAGAWRNFFMGLGFIAISVILAFQGAGWWFWLLIPALAMIGRGVGDMMQARANRAARPAPSLPVAQIPQPPQVPEMTPRPMFSNAPAPSFNPYNTGEIRPAQQPFGAPEQATRPLPAEPQTQRWPNDTPR